MSTGRFPGAPVPRNATPPCARGRRLARLFQKAYCFRRVS